MDGEISYYDLAIAPMAFITILGYHLFLTYKTQTSHGQTYFGFVIDQRRVQLQHILQMEARERGPFMAEMSSSMSLASTYGSYSTTLISLVGGLVSMKQAVDGNTSTVAGAVKSLSVLVFALLSFICFHVGSKTMAHANFLISMPHRAVQPGYIEDVVVQGFVLFEVGNRSFYFSLALAGWFLGPLLMFAACLMLLVGLYMQDMHTIPLEESSPQIE